MISFQVLRTAACGFLLSWAALAQNLVLDPSFEAQPSGGSTPPWIRTTAATGSNTGGSPFNPRTGNRSYRFGAVNADLDAVSQTILTTVAGTTYDLTYYVINLGNAGDTPTNFFQALWNGTSITGSALSNVGSFAYTQFTFSVLAAGNDVLRFEGRNNDSFFRLDDVSLTAAGAPELDPTRAVVPVLFAAVGLLALGSRRTACLKSTC